MREKSKNRLSELREKVNALLSLPSCAINEVISRLGLIDSGEKEYRAQHEAGHALVYLFAGKTMEKAEIHALQGMTCARLNQLFGMEMFNAGEVTIDDEHRFAQEEPKRGTIMYLAGMASTNDPNHGRFFDHILSEGLANGADESWDDISVPYVYIQDRFGVINKRPPTGEEVSKIFLDVLAEIRSVFSEDKFAKALNKVKVLIKERRLKWAINDAILDELYSEGFSSDELTTMQQKLFSIDIDGIVQRFGRVEM